MIAPVNVPPSQLQIIQGPSLDKSVSSAPNISAPNINATASLKKKTQPVLQIAQAATSLNQAVLAAESQNSPTPGLGDEQTQFPKARILPSPLVTPKELPKAGELKSDQLNPNLQPLVPDVQPQNPEQLLPGSQPSEIKPKSKEQKKSEQEVLPQSPDPFSTKPAEVKPDSKEQQKPQAQPLVPETKEQQKPEQTIPAAQPPENPDTKQDSKPVPPPLPSEVFPDSSQPPRSPLPSGPPTSPSNEPANYPNNTGPGGAYYNQNYIAPAVSFGKDTLIGATSRFGIGKNLSIRPSLFLGNTARVAIPLTYDFGFNDNEQFEKNPLVVFHAGAGLDYSSRSGSNTSSLNPLVVFGADVYLGDGASVLLQLGNTFNSDFVAVAGIGLQF
jgi:hypothetical protein